MAWPVKTIVGAWFILGRMKNLYTILEAITMLAVTVLLIGGLVYAEPKVIVASIVMTLTLGSLISFNHLAAKKP